MSEDRLREGLDEAEWGWLRSHAERGAAIMVDSSLDLLEVGRAVASDDSAAVSGWIGRRLLTRPSPAQMASWDETPARRFLSLVVRPYVLMQERALQ